MEKSTDQKDNNKWRYEVNNFEKFEQLNLIQKNKIN